jgi:hypothetical protein
VNVTSIDDSVTPSGLSKTAALIVGVDQNKPNGIVPGISDLAALQQGLVSSTSLVSTTGIVASVPLQGDGRALVLAGSTTNPAQQTAYVATGSYGLAIVDASNFQRPVVLGQLKLAGTATDVGVDTTLNLAAVADGSGGLQIVNVADPTSPKLVQTIPIDATQVRVIDGIAYANNGGAIDAFDLVTGAELQALFVTGATITAIARDGTMLYTMDSSNTLHVIDTSSGAMVLDGSLALPTTGTSLFAAGGVVYVGAGTNNGRNGGYLTVDVSNPAAPKLIEGVDAPNIAGAAIALNGSGLGISVQDIVTNTGSANVVDVVNTSDPTNTGQFITRYTLRRSPTALQSGTGSPLSPMARAGCRSSIIVPSIRSVSRRRSRSPNCRQLRSRKASR